MKSFEGHALPGCYFLTVGVLWSVKYPIKYLMQRENENISKNKWYQYLELLEGMGRVIIALVGILAGQFTPEGPHLHLYTQDHIWVDLLTWIHGTMYFAYGLAGLVDILMPLPLGLPPGLDRFMLSQALFVEGFLFYFHAHHRPPLDQHLHSLMLVAICGGALCSLLEVFVRDHPVLELLRTAMFLLQGSWFLQIGFVLYPPWGGPGWDQTDHENVMFFTMCLSWHYLGALLLSIINYAIVYCCIERWKKYGRWRKIGSSTFDMNSYTPLLLGTDNVENVDSTLGSLPS
ncbi:transmembrane protein 45B-like [Gopherus evgoodei]|uniref:Transmembrane protein 45B n=1 Tax=Gopherus evgoodei TaxID=1825980 RepID=A0A8C4WMX1_9SAUR|nr:transmembrane protein 45B-like [Gopherus evgoodei]XP_030394280.1 transmembrane protein 45B-like [Gopherus evgoodei]